MVVLREAAPDLARIGLDGAAVAPGDAELLQPDALAVEHAEDVVVRHHEEAGRVGKGLVLRIPARIRVPVRRHDRQVAHGFVEALRHGAGRRIGGEEPVLVNEHA